MNGFYVWNVRKGKRFLIIMGLALFAAIFLIIEENSMNNLFSKTEQVALTKGNINEANIALTFNISWGEERVNDILDILQTEDVRATFFVSGEWAERHPQIVDRITKEKHELGMLGYRYKSYLDQEIDQVRKDIVYAREVFKKLGHDKISYIRTPSGHFNKDIIQLAEEIGYEVIHWSVNPNDWENPGVKVIEKHIITNTFNGDIVLLHASDSAKQTAEALQNTLPALRDSGFKFVTISALVSDSSMDEKIVE